MRDWPREARGIDEDVDTATGLANLVGGALDRGRILERQLLDAMLGFRQLREQGLRALGAFVVADHDAGALVGQHPHRRGADPVAAAGDDSDLVFQLQSYQSFRFGSKFFFNPFQQSG